MLMAMMVDWVLTCKIKRNKSRHINGNVTHIMRKCLIKLYCTIQRQKEGSETAILKKELAAMSQNKEMVKEETLRLRKEIDALKRNIGNRPALTENMEVGT